MRVYANDPFRTYEVSGQELRIHWDEQFETVEDMDGQVRTQYSALEAVCHPLDTRDVLIRKIIASVHSLEDELALINNRDDKPEEYAGYQQFRSNAKQLADEYLATRQANG